MNKYQIVEKFQCPGCVVGSDTNCGKCSIHPYGGRHGFRCRSHAAGTSSLAGGRFFLGLPKGFNKDRNNPHILLFTHKDEKPEYDVLNIPVWFTMEDNFLIVKVFCPRINEIMIDVIEDGDPGTDLEFTHNADIDLGPVKHIKSSPIDVSELDMD